MDSTTLVSVGVAGIFTLAVYMCCSLPLQIQIKNASPSQIVALTKVMYTVCRIIVLDKLHSYFGFVYFKSKDNNISKNSNNNSNNINNNNNNNKDEGKKLSKSKKPRSLLSLPPSGLGPNTTSVHPPLPPSPPSPPSPPFPSPSFPPPDIDSQDINSPILNTRMNLNEMQFENDLIDLGQY
jgi:hypothetical protein